VAPRNGWFGPLSRDCADPYFALAQTGKRCVAFGG
jgi:hypothetical protein